MRGHEGLVGGPVAAQGYAEGGRVGLLQRGLGAAIRAFHGSPHKFDRFSLDQIGSGEGAQAYGRGLYFAENEDVARHYRDALARADGDALRVDGVPFSAVQGDTRGSPARAQALGALEAFGYRVPRTLRPGESFDAVLRSRLEQEALDATDRVEREIRRWQRAPEGSSVRARSWDDLQGDLAQAREASDEMRRLAQARFEWEQPGAMYEVRLGVQPEQMLDWDAPLAGQPAEVALRAARDRYGRGVSMAPRTDAEREFLRSQSGFLQHTAETLDGALSQRGSGGDALRLLERQMSPARAADLLRHEGVPGVRYWDGTSRRAGEGTSNFVMFDDEPIEIVRRYAAGGLAGGGGFEGLVEGVGTDAPAYAEGGRVGLLQRGLGAAFRAYHGSPHQFDRFSMDKIGTGEGAQAYGHGLYLTESELVARAYRDALADPLVTVDGERVGSGGVYPSGLQELARRLGLSPQEYDAVYSMHRHPDVTSAVQNLRAQAAMPWRGVDAQRQWSRRADTLEGMADRIRVAPQGHMYEVSVRADPGHLLDWDRGVSEQSEAVGSGVNAALRRSGLDRSVADHVTRNRSGREAYTAISRGQYDLRQGIDEEGAPRASQLLRDEGVPGIRYLDRFSRDAGEGTSNFVMFDDEPIEIVRRYAQGGLAGAPGAMAQPGAPMPARQMAGGQPGPADEIAATQGAAMRGVAQAQQMWSAAGSLIGGGGQAMAHSGLVG